MLSRACLLDHSLIGAGTHRDVAEEQEGLVEDRLQGLLALALAPRPQLPVQELGDELGGLVGTLVDEVLEGLLQGVPEGLVALEGPRQHPVQRRLQVQQRPHHLPVLRHGESGGGAERGLLGVVFAWVVGGYRSACALRGLNEESQGGECHCCLGLCSKNRAAHAQVHLFD